MIVFNTQKTHLCEVRAGTKLLSGHISKSVLPLAWVRVVTVKGQPFQDYHKLQNIIEKPKKKKKSDFDDWNFWISVDLQG